MYKRLFLVLCIIIISVFTVACNGESVANIGKNKPSDGDIKQASDAMASVVLAIYNGDAKKAVPYISSPGEAAASRYVQQMGEEFKKIAGIKTAGRPYTLSVSTQNPKPVDKDTIKFDVNLQYDNYTETITGIRIKREKGGTWKIDLMEFFEDLKAGKDKAN